MMKHAQGADFARADKLWEEAGLLSSSQSLEEETSEQDPEVLSRSTSQEKEESEDNVVADERRFDPTDSIPLTLDEFLMKHAQGADFRRGEFLWENAVRFVDDDDEA